MKLDLLDFTQNPAFANMIHNKGFSFAMVKTIFTLILLPLPFGFFINSCSSPATFTHPYTQNENVLLVLILVVFIYFSIRYVTPVIKKYRSQAWKKTTAKIIELGIFQVTISRRFGHIIEYFPAVIYIFEIDGKSYQSMNMSFNSDYVYNLPLDPLCSSQYHRMNGLFSKWIEEKKLDIYYNPNNPKESVVFRNFQPTRKLFYLILGTLSTMALLVSLYNLLCYAYWIT